MSLTSRKVAGYGWRRDLPDHRDLIFAEVHSPNLAALPPSVDLSAKMPPVFDQGVLGSCTANALCAAFGFLHPGFIGSRLQLYYDERLIEGDVRQDAGAQIRDGVKVLNQTGVGPESEWPYVPTKFAHRPPAHEMTDAARHKISAYSRLVTGADFHQCLAAGFPFVIGFSVMEAFESAEVARTGVVPMPTKADRPIGGHAVCVIGYDDHAGTYTARNSWGNSWGAAGNFTVLQAYFENPRLASDAWTLRA